MLQQTPPSPTLRRDPDGRLILHHEGKRQAVAARPCFPWTEPNRHISLRDEENKELGHVESLSTLEEESRSALEKTLIEARFSFRIERILSVRKDFEIRVWEVLTAQGERTLLTKWDDFPHRLEEGRFLLKDLSGDLYVIPDPTTLDKHSRQLLWAFTA